MKKNVFLATLIIFHFITISCNEKNDITCFDKKSDTLYYLEELPYEVKSAVLGEIPIYQDFIGENLYMTIYERKKMFYFIFKERVRDNINRYFLINESYPAYCSDYDSSEYDVNLFTKMRLETDLSLSEELSRSYFDIHKIRNNSKQYQQKTEEFSLKIIDLENLINKLNIFNNFSSENNNQVDVLKRLIFHTRISTLNFDNSFSFSTSSKLLSYNSIKEISNEIDLQNFKNELDTNQFNGKIIWSYWRYQNHKHLLSKIEYIRQVMNEPNSFIFYTTFTEKKLFIYRIKCFDKKISLKEEYVNKDYFWFNPNMGISIPSITM